MEAALFGFIATAGFGIVGVGIIVGFVVIAVGTFLSLSAYR